MANRSYLYSLSNRPKSYYDRPETITGLSEWPYAVPFTYRVLMSGDPQLCASLVSDGFEDEPKRKKSKLHAISSTFDTGFDRLTKFFEVVRSLSGKSRQLLGWLDETVAFLESHRDRYLLLETIELDCMTEDKEAALRACVEKEIKNCVRAGAAVDALPAKLADSGKCLKKATREKCKAPLSALFGLRLDDDCDNTYEQKTEYPLGLEWTDVLYFELWNKAQFEANR